MFFRKKEGYSTEDAEKKGGRSAALAGVMGNQGIQDA